MNVEECIGEGRLVVEKLLKAKLTSCGDLTPAKLPQCGGIYIFVSGETSKVLRAGRTENLRQRIYQNHLMGKQAGNLRSQLVKSGKVNDLDEAKEWIRQNCSVAYLEDNFMEGLDMRWAEHFMLAVLRPRFSD